MAGAVGWLTAVTLILGVACVLPGWVYGLNVTTDDTRRTDMGMLSRAPEIVHALFLGVLLTRPAVQRLFTRDSATEDRE